MGNVHLEMVSVLVTKAGKVNFVLKQYANITILEITVFINATAMPNIQNCKSNNFNFVLFHKLEMHGV